MRSDKTPTPAEAEKKKKRLRFAGLVILTVLVIAAVIITALAVKSCEERVNLDIGQTYDAGRAKITVTDVEVKEYSSSQVYAIITVNVQAVDDFTFDPYGFELDGVPPMELSGPEFGHINTDKINIVAGQSADVKLAFSVPRSMKVSFLTYKKAVIRIGSMIEN